MSEGPLVPPDAPLTSWSHNLSAEQRRLRAGVSARENTLVRTVLNHLSSRNSAEDSYDLAVSSRAAKMFDSHMNYGIQHLRTRRRVAAEIVNKPSDLASLHHDTRMHLRHLVFKVSAQQLNEMDDWLMSLEEMRKALQDHSHHITMITIEDFMSHSLLEALGLALPHVTYLDVANAVPLTAEHMAVARRHWPRLLELHMNLYPVPGMQPERLCRSVAVMRAWGLEHIEVWHCFQAEVRQYECLFQLASLKRLAFHNLNDEANLRDVDIDWRYATSLQPGPILRHVDPPYANTFTMYLERVQLPLRRFTPTRVVARPMMSRWVKNPGVDTHTAYGTVAHEALQAVP